MICAKLTAKCVACGGLICTSDDVFNLLTSPSSMSLRYPKIADAFKSLGMRIRCHIKTFNCHLNQYCVELVLSITSKSLLYNDTYLTSNKPHTGSSILSSPKILIIGKDIDHYCLSRFSCFFYTHTKI